MTNLTADDDDASFLAGRARAAALASECLDVLCADYARGKPDASDVIRLAFYTLRQIREATGVNLLLRHDPATGVTFS